MSIQTKIVQPSSKHEQLRLALCSCVKRKAPDMPPEELLAVLCLLVGQLTALQDQRRYTPESIMALVTANIEMGNLQARDALLSATRGTA